MTKKKCKEIIEYLKENSVPIYDDLTAIEAQKGKNSLWPNEPFRHNFEKQKGKAAVYGLPDGSLLITGTKKLWKEFNYD